MPTADMPVGPLLPTDHTGSDAHTGCVGGGSTPAGQATGGSTPKPRSPDLLDGLLTLASITLDDLEKLRIAQENRYRSLTQHGASDAGHEYGFGLDDNDPQVAQAGAMVDAIKGLEHTAALNLKRLMRKHPLGDWGKSKRGVGEKQLARLLGVIGDPYVNGSTGQPRTVSQLWAYCGLHTLPASQDDVGTQKVVAGGGSTSGSDTNQRTRDAHTSLVRVAARRQKGTQANWSSEAKSRAYLIAESCMKAGGPYRDTYDTRKAKTEGRLHASPCAPCGTKGKPAPAGTPWRDGHRHADALRIVSKTILRDLWRAARDTREARP